MRKFKRHQRHSLPFGLFLAMAGALLLQAAVAPRANAADASWTGGTNTTWSTSTNWTAGGPPVAGQTASFNSAFTNQPNLTANATVGRLLMTTGVAQNVTISDSANLVLTIGGVAGTGIQIDSTVGAFTLTLTTGVAINAAQAWTNNSGNLFTVSGNMTMAGNALTVNGTGDTLISGIIAGGMGSILTKDGTGTLTLTGTNIYDDNTIVNGGTLLVNSAASGTGMGDVTVNTGATLGGTGVTSSAVTVNAGGSIAPGNGGNTSGILTISGALTLASTSNFRVDINGPAAGTGYDQISAGNTVNVTGSNLVVTVNTTVTVGQQFTIVNKTSGGAVTGTFAGIPQGGTVVGSDGTVFTVSYVGGDGNNIVLTVQALVPEPSTYISGALAIAGLAFTQRRRLRKLIPRRCAVGS